MEKKTKYMIIETLVIFAYAYAIQGYDAAAIFISVFAIMMTIECQKKPQIIRAFKTLLLPVLIIVIMDGVTGMLTKMPSLFAPVIASVFCPLAFHHNSPTVMKSSAVAECVGLAGTLLILLCMNSITAFTRICAIMLAAEVYLPCIIVYILRRISVRVHTAELFMEETGSLR